MHSLQNALSAITAVSLSGIGLAIQDWLVGAVGVLTGVSIIVYNLAKSKKELAEADYIKAQQTSLEDNQIAISRMKAVKKE